MISVTSDFDRTYLTVRQLMAAEDSRVLAAVRSREQCVALSPEKAQPLKDWGIETVVLDLGQLRVKSTLKPSL